MTTKSTQTKVSDPDWSKAFRGTKDVVWYVPNIDKKVKPETRKLLESYSNIPSEDVLEHVRRIRDEAWAIRSYPCTGIGLFLSPMISKSTAYSTIIKRLQAGQSFLDVGCFLGHDLRRLVFDGAPSDRLYGVDIVSHWDVGYDMFRDRGRFSACFIEADILHPNAELHTLTGTIDIISMTHVFHQWDWDDQVTAGRQLCGLTRSSSESIIVGFQIGSVGLKERPANDLNGIMKTACYWHDPETFQRMWDEIGRDTNTKWKVEAEMKTWEEIGWDPEDVEYLGQDARVIQWVVWRVQG